MRNASKLYKLVPTPEELANRFLGEVIAAVLCREIPFDDEDDPAQSYLGKRTAVWAYFRALKPHATHEDFDGRTQLPVPQLLTMLVDPYTLYSYFRAWLRKQGIDPDTVAPITKRAA